jgi:hypothetical protein
MHPDGFQVIPEASQVLACFIHFLLNHNQEALVRPALFDPSVDLIYVHSWRNIVAHAARFIIPPLYIQCNATYIIKQQVER